ncbi:MAG: DUF839 domain-containing protein [Methylophaga sp.]|nr:DUF839 domain-containing protein [Methylophaga sp.]
MKFKYLSALVASAIAAPAWSADFGKTTEQLLKAQSLRHFGIVRPLDNAALGNTPRQPGQNARDLIDLAPGLRASILTRSIGSNADMVAFWPSDENPTHSIWCIEVGRQDLGVTLDGTDGIVKYNPAVQAVDMRTGEITTLLRGMERCDGIRSTAWGTILATEETGDGAAYEIIDPLNTFDHTIIDRASGEVIDALGNRSQNVVKRPALPIIAWEGLAVLENGVVIAGDELRPGSQDLGGDGQADPDSDGGAIFKFVPTVPRVETGNISALTQSPLVSGSVYAFRASCRNGGSSQFNINYGQGCEIGNGSWVEVTAATARRDAALNGATGYYRPEDLHRDPVYAGEGVRFCWANTGNEGAKNFGEVICGIDSNPLVADETQATVEVNRFVEGNTDFNSFDNLAFQPESGILYVIEDHPNGDIFACLRDGEDRDIKTDGCIRVLSVKDQSAEPTGFTFLGDGRSAILSIQHSNDANCTVGSDCGPVDGFATDDLVLIEGFRILDSMLPSPAVEK